MLTGKEWLARNEISKVIQGFYERKESYLLPKEGTYITKNALWEILVPCTFGDNAKPVRTKHHKEWDKLVKRISSGLTILSTGKGQWDFEGETHHDKVIPVRFIASSKQADKLADFTRRHYRQKSVMYYKISDDVRFANK